MRWLSAGCLSGRQVTSIRWSKSVAPCTVTMIGGEILVLSEPAFSSQVRVERDHPVFEQMDVIVNKVTRVIGRVLVPVP